jgi:hypothetical protein
MRAWGLHRRELRVPVDQRDTGSRHSVLTPFDRLVPETAETLWFSDDVRNRHVLGTIVARFPKPTLTSATKRK